MSRNTTMFHIERVNSQETANIAAKKMGYDDIQHYQRKADGTPDFDLGWCLAMDYIHQKGYINNAPLVEACEEAAAFIGSLGIAGGITTQKAWIQAAKVLEQLNEVIESEKK